MAAVPKEGSLAVEEKVVKEMKILKAGVVYLLMKNDYCISYSVRTQWFLDHLNRTLGIVQQDNLNDCSSEITVVSVIPKETSTEWQLSTSHLFKYLVTPTTQLVFLSQSYSIVYCLDMSPSLSAVDIQHGQVMIDEVFLALERSLDGITKPFVIPGTNTAFRPAVHVTVIAHTPFFTTPAQQVLMQGYEVTMHNLPMFLNSVQRQLELLEDTVAEVAGIAHEQLEAVRAECDKLVGGLFEDSEMSSSPTPHVPMVTPDSGFVNMLRYGMLALRLLPESSSPNMVVITDGIIAGPDVHVFDSVMSQLRTSSTACSFLHVGSLFHPHCCEGLVPYTDLMQFIAIATGGVYMSCLPVVVDCPNLNLNVYHRKLLTWTLKKSTFSGNGSGGSSMPQWRVRNVCFYGSRQPQLLRKKQMEGSLTTSLISVLCCRLKEGYFIRGVKYLDNHMELSLVLPWKNHIYIEYVASAPLWAISGQPSTVPYAIWIQAPYEFLHDITCKLKKPFQSQYRQAVVSRFWSTLKSLTQSDQLVVHLNSFPTNPAAHTVPESIRSGLPVFYLPANSTIPVLSSTDLTCPVFAQFWRPICMLDPSVWHKWLHTHRLGLLLQHDHPLPRHLHLANSSGRFQVVQCRQAAASLYALLKDISTFVLIENHSYVKLLLSRESGSDRTPTWFYIMRATSKPPYVVINIAFLGGTPSMLRHEIVREIRQRTMCLALPQRPNIQAHSPPMPGSPASCCLLLRKPVEKILVRYERMPTDLTTVVFPDGTQPAGAPWNSASPQHNPNTPGLLTTLSRYLHHRRWIWAAQDNVDSALATVAVARILAIITKMRLQEGFHFAHSTAGIINMVLEVDMKGTATGPNEEAPIQPCVIQYVLFPPHATNTTTKDSGSEDEGTDDGGPEMEPELQIIAECWIEPQHGVVVNCPAKRLYMDNLPYYQLPDVMCKVDAECISTLLAFEQLSLLCLKPEVSAPLALGEPTFTELPLNQSTSSLSAYALNIASSPEKRIHYIPFAFNLMSLLPKCHQAEQLFSMFIQDLGRTDGKAVDADAPNITLCEMFLHQLQQHHDRELFLSTEDSMAFLQLVQSRSRDQAAPALPFPSVALLGSSVSESLASDTNTVCFNSHPPRWRCYARSISSTHVTLTFAPASYADLKCLMLNELGLTGAYPRALKLASHNQDQESVSEPCWSIDDSNMANVSCSSSCDLLAKKHDSFPPFPKRELFPDTPFRGRACSLETAAYHSRNPNRIRTGSMDSKNNSRRYLEDIQSSIVQSSDVSLNASLFSSGSIQPSPEKVASNAPSCVQKSCSSIPPLLFSSPDKKSPCNQSFLLNSSDKSSPSILPTHVLSERSSPSILPQSWPDKYLDSEPRSLDKPSCPSPSWNQQFGALTMPIYMYDCPLSLLVETLVFKESAKTSCFNVYEDHTNKEEANFDKLVTEEAPKRFSPDEPKSDSSDSAVQEPTLRDQSRTTAQVFFRCFVLALFESLHQGENIAAPDIQSAVDECEEALLEIDITRFIQTVCGHMRDFRTKKLDETKLGEGDVAVEQLHFPLSLLNIQYPCQNLRYLHRQIKDKFNAVLSNGFKVVPSHPEFYFCVQEAVPQQAAEVGSVHTGKNVDEERKSTDLEDIEFCVEPMSSTEAKSFMSGQSSEASSVNDMEELTARQNQPELKEACPLFLHLTCSVRSEGKIGSCSVRSVPTCLNEMRAAVDSSHLDLKHLQVTLDILCLTLPPDMCGYRKNCAPLRTSSPLWAGEGDQLASTDTSIESPADHDFPVDCEMLYDRLHHLPEYQHLAVTSAVLEAEWLLRDTALALLEAPTSERSLRLVADHVATSPDRPTCLAEEVPLEFVFGPEQSFQLFLAEFLKVCISGYYVRQEGSFYYLAADFEASKEKLLGPPLGSGINYHHHGDGLHMNNINKRVLETDSDCESPRRKPQLNLLNSSKHSECSSDFSSRVLTEDDFVGDSHSIDFESDCEWLADLETTRPSIPKFWLVMTVETTNITTYFHHRNLSGGNDDSVMYREIQSNAIACIKNLVKLVNQTLLLSNLHNTRMCDQLLEPEASEDIWKPPPLVRLKSTDDGNEEPGQSSYLEATMKFMPGWFACSVVWESHLALHPRLKSGPGFSRGLQALRGVLNRFSVNNRANMFVYQDNTGNVFYFRLQESVRTGTARSDTDESSPTSVSRSSSVASLNARRLATPEDPNDLRPRLRSFGEKDAPSPRAEETVVLKVHGITAAGPEVKEELVQVLQNRLDDAVLEVLVVMLARNPMCKLTPDDVHFIQKPGCKPKNLIRFTIQPHAHPHLQALAFYLRQNLLQFLHIPKYTDTRAEYHFQDHSEPESSGKRVNEADLFLYNQSPSSGSKGIACLALALVAPSGLLISHDNYPKPSVNAYLEILPKDQFETLTSTTQYTEEHFDEPIVEFRIWKQGRVNVESLVGKLKSAMTYALWDLLTEFCLLTAPLPETHITPKRMRRRPTGDNSELPRSQPLPDVYHETMLPWLDFAIDLNVPAVKKNSVILSKRHSLTTVVKEVQNLITLNASDTTIWVFYSTSKHKYMSLGQGEALPSLEDSISCLILGRNLKQWQGSVIDRDCYEPDILHPKAQKGFHRFTPLVDEQQFVPRQRLAVAVLTNEMFNVYTYNWSKDRVESLGKQLTTLGQWLGARAQLLRHIVVQKMGLFHARKEQGDHQIITSEVDQLLKFTPSGIKERKVVFDNSDIFRDSKPNSQSLSPSNVDPILLHSNQMVDLKSNLINKEDRKKLYVMWQARGATPNIPLAEDMIVLFRQHARLIHYCLTPLLFLPRWRVRSAATRDHMLLDQSPLTQNSNAADKWHHMLCNNFITEYKQYLQTLGFIPIQAEPSMTGQKPASNTEHKRKSGVVDQLDAGMIGPNVCYLQKSLLGGILLLELTMSEPFFHANLHALECSRLQGKTSTALLMSQFTLSFVDECDRMKVLLHLHSFTYDYHLRSIQTYLAGQSLSILRQGFHLIHFLEDFLKYYNKAPNFARNLVHSDVVSVSDVSTSAQQLYNYLLSHEKAYDMEVFRMVPATSDISADNEYVLVQLSQTPHLTYRDFQDVKQSDDFDVTLITWHDGTIGTNESTLHLNYYLILTSRRELFPKLDIERKIGKFCTVSTAEVEESQPPPTSHEIRRESVNYLGYYSSHEQLMQRLMNEQNAIARERINTMVQRGSVHCRTHLLWNKLHCGGMTTSEFSELRSLSTCESLSSLDPRLSPMLAQSVPWYLALVKVLAAKYPDHHRLMTSADNLETHLAVLHPRHLDTFMLLSVDQQAGRGELSAVYRKNQDQGEPSREQREFNQSDVQCLIQGFVNACCFHLWPQVGVILSCQYCGFLSLTVCHYCVVPKSLEHIDFWRLSPGPVQTCNVHQGTALELYVDHPYAYTIPPYNGALVYHCTISVVWRDGISVGMIDTQFQSHTHADNNGM